MTMKTIKTTTTAEIVTSTTAVTTITPTKTSHYIKVWTLVPYLQYLIQEGAL